VISEEAVIWPVDPLAVIIMSPGSGNTLISRPGIINVNGWPPLIQPSGIIIQKKRLNFLEEGGIGFLTPVVAIFDKGS